MASSPQHSQTRTHFTRQYLKATSTALYKAAKKQASEGENYAVSPPKKLPYFVSQYPVPPFKWKPTDSMNIDPTKQGWTFCDLLMNDAYVDKSSALYYLLKNYFNSYLKDFRSVPVSVIYPRRLGKTTLLDFIEAVYSPLPCLGGYESTHLKTRIASLERGKELLQFGLHPVLRLNLKGILSIGALNDHINMQVERAGVDDFSVKKTTSPAHRVLSGAKMLNEKFEAETGVPTKTIVLIDNFDEPFRDKDRSCDDPLFTELGKMVSVGNLQSNSISLLALSGLTRIVGNYLDKLNNHYDVSKNSVFHGLCGISARELIKCADGQLDHQVKTKYNGQSFEEILMNKFVPEWSGFRLGIDSCAGQLDPTSPAGALFSPLDVWEIVQSLLLDGLSPPLPQWIAAIMEDDGFDLTSFKKYEKSDFELFRNLLGGWIEEHKLKMDRPDYFELDNDWRVMKVLFEFGLLTVKEVNCNMVRLGPPNWPATRNALSLLIKPDEVTPASKAKKYLTEVDFKSTVSKSARRINNDMHRSKINDVLLDFPFEEHLFMELLYRFPDLKVPTRKRYELYKVVSVYCKCDVSVIIV
jgi:hypothetical protein